MADYWKDVLPVDPYVVKSRSMLQDIDRQIITQLYQPLIGPVAFSLYMTLWGELEQNRLWGGESTHRQLMGMTQSNLKTIHQEQGKLEGIGLLKVYMKESERQERLFIYELLPPVVKVLDEEFGIESGLMTTVHAYTNDQKNIDNPHKDLRRARACGESIIPTTTGAAKALSLVLPHLKGKLHGLALRVPVPNVSLVDLVVDLKTDVTAEEVNEAFKRAAKTSMYGVLDYSDEPLVSTDYNTNPHSAVIDGLTTMVMEDRKVKVLAWYDNEWGYSCRVVDLIRHVAARMKHPSAV